MNDRFHGDEMKRSLASKIMIALDFPNADQARRLVEQLQGIPCWFKVGMELFYSEGPQIVRELKAAGHSVFVDLKLHDIPNTVKGAAASLTRLGADMFNVHAAGGMKMMKAAIEGAEEAAVGKSPAGASPSSRPLIIAVTQLTSTGQDMLNEELGIPGTIEECVRKYAISAQQAGLDGVVSSAREAAMIKQACGETFVTVTPGIRPAWSAKGDQHRVIAPKQALQQGSDFLVIGRPVTQAESPVLAFTRIIEELSEHE